MQRFFHLGWINIVIGFTGNQEQTKKQIPHNLALANLGGLPKLCGIWDKKKGAEAPFSKLSRN
jgi:hypothetical protein